MAVTLFYNETVYTEELMSTVDVGLISYGNTTQDTNDKNALPFHLRITLLVMISTILTIGVTGNTLAIYIFLKTKTLRTPPNFLIVNLSVSDLAMITSNCPMMLMSIHYGYWYFGDVGCSIYAFSGATFSFVSIGSMTAIALDRYYVICHCFHALMNVSRNRTFVIIFLVWLYACLWSVPPFVGIGAYVKEGYGIGCTFDFMTRNLTTQIHITILYIGGFVSPIITIMICYGKIVKSVGKHRKEIESYNKAPSLAATSLSSASASSSASVKSQSQSKNRGGLNPKRGDLKLSRLMAHYQLTRVGIIATVVFTLSWGPYAIIALYRQFVTHKQSMDTTLQVVPVLFAKMSSIWNPFVYVLSHKRFKKALIETLGKARRCRDTGSTNDTESQEINNTTPPDVEKSSSSTRKRSSNAMQPLPEVLQATKHKQPVGHRHSNPENPTTYKPAFDVEVAGKPSTPKGLRNIELEVISGSKFARMWVTGKSWHPQDRDAVGVN